ncbi:MAG TPA: substrate-binding domain-containing protein [Pseudolabrys sp.]|nr:substrate-binding domain-containing protein [Pseudolabrys sp.]
MIATIRILSTHAALDVLNVLGPKFERAHGCRLSYGYDPAKAVKRQVETGAAFDVAIVTRPVFDDLVAQGRMLAEPRADVGRSGLGLSVRAGAAKPDIGTTEAFKRTLLAAKSVARSTEGTSGIYFDRLIERLGLAEAMRDKIVLGPSGRVAELVARGEAEMAVQQVPELLPVAGAQYVGPFPPELQLYSDFTAGIASASRHRDVAAAFVKALTAPEAAALFKAAGLEPT